jgi:group II intron reverse transcriptase/maturase
MQNAKTVLGVIQERGRRGLTLEHVYRQLFNRNLFLTAYGRIARNQGALTPGVTTETVDSMSMTKIDTIISALRDERYQWTPARRIYIKKKNSIKKRPLGLPTWSDKLVQEVIRLILEAFYEPQFSTHSHGFRAGRGCQSALTEVYHNWRGTTWFIEGDISTCFDSFNHDVLRGILAERIKDNRFLRIIRELLNAGYLEEWAYNKTLSGTPQGGVVSPILANIYLDRLDKFVEQTLIQEFNRGDRRKDNRVYQTLHTRIKYWERKGDWAKVKELDKEYRSMPSKVTKDFRYRRLKYIRYADDFLLGFHGPKVEAEAIKQRLADFLETQLKLKLSETKTLVTHARQESARFLGYEVTVLNSNASRDSKGNRNINGQVAFRVPELVIKTKRKPYERSGKPMHRPELLCNEPFSIVAQYQAEYRGVVEYYRMAHNLHTLGTLKRVMELSLIKTLARKYRCSCVKVYKKLKTRMKDGNIERSVLQVVVEREGKKPLLAQWGGISLVYNVKTKILDDQPPQVWNRCSELVERLLADTCELCCSTKNVEVHHVRKLADLQKEGKKELPKWARFMIARRRKTLVVCRDCHEDLHRMTSGKEATG